VTFGVGFDDQKASVADEVGRDVETLFGDFEWFCGVVFDREFTELTTVGRLTVCEFGTEISRPSSAGTNSSVLPVASMRLAAE